jgi:hypothetical protein
MKPGDEVIIRGRLVEDFGDDVTVRVEAPRGSTVVQVAKRNIKLRETSSGAGAVRLEET